MRVLKVEDPVLLVGSPLLVSSSFLASLSRGPSVGKMLRRRNTCAFSI